jgi:hypothetical protein
VSDVSKIFFDLYPEPPLERGRQGRLRAEKQVNGER